MGACQSCENQCPACEARGYVIRGGARIICPLMAQPSLDHFSMRDVPFETAVIIPKKDDTAKKRRKKQR